MSRGKESEAAPSLKENPQLENHFYNEYFNKIKGAHEAGAARRGRKVVSSPNDGGKNFRATEATLKATRAGRTHNIFN